MGGRYHLHSNGARVSLSGRGDGLGEPLRAGLALVESARCELLHRSPGGRTEPGAAQIFNTDQGSQFTDDDFTGVLRAHGVAISMDGRGRFADNIFVERLWRSLKYEEVYLKAYENVAEARQGITAYFEFYNYQRLHQALAYRTPRQVFDAAAPLASSARGKNAGACPTRSAQ